MMKVMMRLVIRLLCKNMIVKCYCCFEVKLVDDDYDDDVLVILT